jgi:hypothetical protein
MQCAKNPFWWQKPVIKAGSQVGGLPKSILVAKANIKNRLSGMRIAKIHFGGKSQY